VLNISVFKVKEFKEIRADSDLESVVDDKKNYDNLA
jgi:hypothetical protein